MPHDVRRQTAVASVCAGGLDTRYVRAGAGPIVLLLVDTGLEEITAGRAFRDLVAGDHRVVAPEIPAGGGRGGTAAWLRDFLEGLGLERPAVVAVPALRAVMDELAGEAPGLLGEVRFLTAP